MGPDVPLDTILKKFTIVYGNVKSFDLLMRDFYRADQGKRSQSLPLPLGWRDFCPRLEINFPEKFTHTEEQKLLKDWLFHGCKKNVRDSVKYCFANPQVDYMQS